MPLHKGKGSMDSNMSELMAKYKTTGKIGNTRPKDRKHAMKIALAIAYEKKRGK